MNGRDYWEEFCHTGKIEAYLSYRGMADSRNTRQDTGAGLKEDGGTWTNAGAGSCHRDDIKS